MTTPLPPQPPQDDDLPGEAELKALYGRLPKHEPGPALDAVVLRAAAQAVERRAPRRHARWPVALGTAATLVLAAGLVWQMRKLPAEAPVTSPALGPAIPADAQADAGRPAIGTTDAALQKAQRVKAQTMQTEPARLSAPTAKMIENRPASPPPTATGYVAPTASTATGTGAPKVTASRIGTGDIPAAKSAEPAPAPIINETTTPAPPVAPSPTLDQAAADERMDAAASAPTPPAPMIEAAPVPESAPAPDAAPFASAPAAAAPMAMPQSHASSTMQRLRAAEPSEQATPAMTAELQAIRALYDQGHSAAARARLEAFHRQHPHVVLPDDLRQQLDGKP